MKNAQTDFVPVYVAAHRLGVPLAWLRREAQAGRVPAVRAGRRWFVHLERTRAKLTQHADAAKGGEP
ncbi:MAG: hypothetical protein COB69_03640 [Phycisphaera sp.]|nr:MAG: hypothetical protein COB69_03640 [Phycisphaera sp.]